MIISRAPYRVSFLGGGTDYPAYFTEHGGAVLSCTVNKYCWITARHLPPFFRHKSRIVWSQIELVQHTSEIQHPSARACLESLGLSDVEIHYDGDLPGGTGMGSSSAFTVALLLALYAMKGQIQAPIQVAQQAIRIEQDVLRETVGCQDQVAAALGGINKIEFSRLGVNVTRLPLSPATIQALESHMTLFYCGLQRSASEIAREQVSRVKDNTETLSAMRAMVDQGIDCLAEENFEKFGSLLHEAWLLKRALAGNVSTHEIDRMYETARQAGAWGGKVLGAGGGGFLLVFRPPEIATRMSEALAGALEVPVRLEHQGARIVYYDRE